MAFVIAFRPESVGTDTRNYIYFYNSICQDFLILSSFEYLFQGILLFFSTFSAPPAIVFWFLAFVNLTMVILLALKLSSFVNKKIDSYRLFFILSILFLISPFFFAIMVNVIRQGTATLALFVFCIVLAARKPLFALVPLSFLALGFHKTSLITIIFSPLILCNYRVVFITTLISALLYITGLTTRLIYWVSQLTGINLYLKITDYANSGIYHTGVRYDFALFTIFMGLGFKFLSRYFLAIEDRTTFKELLKIYWVLVLPFFFFGFAAYSDRYLLAGWLYLSVLAAVFSGLLIGKYRVPVGWDFLIFLCSTMYFGIKVQGLI
ncbi:MULTISPECIES: EpsG family protein [unclassified Legionella]|uniref:EpsG family protein n=1 Tax=unclassified Legionella TaxID=2622702 RepID=UPI0013EFA6CE|nr:MULTISPECIES: EpsG family protein [unclassified Legionella]MDI9817775.1 EpsG family protein [Legionella sp. PL877]